MKTNSVLVLLTLLPGLPLQAEPLVVGYERFHSSSPDAEGGRLLYNELGCVNCHGATSGLPARRGPNLAGVTQRISPDWIRGFLVAPSTVRPGTAMPHLLPADKPEDIDAVLGYLAELKAKPAPKAKAIRHVNAEHGKELFHAIGCVACHAPAKDAQTPEGAPKPEDFTYASIPFPKLEQKYVLSTLSTFLRDPLQTRPDGRMPRIDMEEQDATDLAGYLLQFTGSDGSEAPTLTPLVSDPAKAARGREIVTAARCAACHELPKDVSSAVVILRKNDGGCLASDSTHGVPHYELTEGQHRALSLFLKERNEAVPTAQLAALTIEALNCMACHELDNHGGPDSARKSFFQGDHNLGDTGRYAPPLTGIGRKLQPDWFKEVLLGHGRVRPYIQTKMPVFGRATDSLPEQLASVDAKTEIPLPGGDDTAGRKLLGTQGGVGCITCHRWGGKAALGIQALDLSNIGQRLQPGWLRDYLIHPAGYRKDTLMPSFWPEGRATNSEILGGDTAHQIASIYAFAKSANGEPEGFPATTGGEFELIPKVAPIVQRTFLEGTGTHAILVGFPEGIHLAYDGKTGQPSMAWRGKFFDAYSTWFSRFAPFEKPLGEGVVKWPASVSTDRQFEGYRLDAKKVPIFLLKTGGKMVSERFEAIDGGLRRTFTGDAAALKSLGITHPEGVLVKEEPVAAPNTLSFVYLWK